MIVEHAITSADITFGIVVLGAFGGLWARLESARAKVADDLAQFKLEVTRNYVRSENLLEMEKRVLSNIENLTENVNGLRKDVMGALSNNARRRT
jgi:hypothetical protein